MATTQRTTAADDTARKIRDAYVNPGWTPAAWAARLRQLADRCADMHPEHAERLRQWAASVEAKHPPETTDDPPPPFVPPPDVRY